MGWTILVVGIILLIAMFAILIWEALREDENNNRTINLQRNKDEKDKS